MNIKIKKHLLLLFSFLTFFGVSFSQNTFNFELTYVDVNGDVNGIVGENIIIPVQAIFFQEEGQCEGETGPCSAFIVNSLDPTIDIDNTIREVQNVTFTDPGFGFTNLNNDFSGNGSIGFEDLLTDYEIWPPNSSITNCQYTPVPGSDSFLASSICKDDVINLTNNIGQFVVELVATFPTDCDDAPADGINDNQAFWFLHFNLYFPDEIEITSNSSESCGFNTSCAGENDGEITAIVSGGVPPYSYVWTNDSGTIISNSDTATGLIAGFYTVTVTDDQDDLIFDSNGDGEGVVCSETFEITEPDPLDIILSTSESNLTLDCAGDSDGSIFVNVTGGCEPYNYSWSNGTTGEAAENLTAGTYTLTITDSNGCVEIFSQEITEPSPIEVLKNEATSVDSDGCANLGAIDIEVSGGTPFIADPEYNYLWQTDSDGDGVGDSFFSNNEDISNLGANIYYLTVTDALGCEFNTSYIITWPGPFTVLIEETSKLDLDCFGDCDGSINIVPGGGSGSYSYAWTAISGEIPAGQENNQNLIGLCSGSYLVTLTDTSFPDCIWNQLIDINEPDEELAISLIDSKLELDCFGDCDGFIDINVSGGTGLYIFDWSNADSTEDISELCAGIYEIIVTDENGCTASQSFEITEPSEPLSLDFVKNDNTCFGSCQGDIDITVTGGTPPYNYSWSNGFNDEDIFDLCTGTYILSVTDDNGCEISGNYEITEPEEIIITGELSDYNGYPVSCYLATDGTINITVTGGSGSYTYLWEPAFALELLSITDNTTEDLVGLGLGFYTVTVTDVNDPTCTATATYEMFEPVPFGVGIDEIGQVNCNNSCDGFINITAYGGANVDWEDTVEGEGVPPGDPNTYTYNWTGPDGFTSNEADISGLCPGTYTVIVTDINGCSECATPASLEETIDETTIITCDIVITEPDELITTIDITPPACSGYPGCITLNTIGGTGIYNYTFYEDNGNTGPDEDCIPETEDILFEPTITDGCFDIVSGDYYVVTTDENGCCTVNNFTVSNADEVSVDINEVPDCYPNESMLVLSGWTPPNETYTIVIFDNDTDNDGLDNINNNNNPLDTDIDNIDGDNLVDPDIDGDGILNENDYIDVDENGVFNTGDVNTEYLFSNPPLYDFVYDQQADILCGDFLGGIWDGNGTGSGTCNEFPLLYDGGATVVLIIAESGCFNFQLVSNDNDIYLPIETTNEILSPNCFGESDIFEFENNDIDGDGVYDDEGNCISSCNDDDPDIDGDGIVNEDDDDVDGDGCLDDGTYTNEECQTCGCSGEITINILEDEDYTPDYTVYISSLIYAPDGNLIYLSPNSDADNFDIDNTYIWLNDGDPDDDNDGLFDYEDEFPFDSNNDGIDDCVGPVYDCDNDGILNEDDPDQDNDGILNEEDDLFSLSNLIDNNFITAYSETNGNLTVSDSDGDGLLDQLNLTNLCTGEYLYVVQDANGCESLPVVFEVEEVDELIVDVNTGADPPVICLGDCTGFIDLTVSGGTPFGPSGPDGIEGNADDGQPYLFEWSNGEGTEDISDLCNGTYTVTVTDANGCCEIIERTIVESPVVEVTLTSGTELSCFGDCNGEIQIDVSGGVEPYSFNWTGPNGFISTDEDLIGLCAGTYTLNGIDSTIGVNGEGCDFIFEVIITEPEELIITDSLLSIYECDYNVSCFEACDGSIDITVDGGNNPYTYEWINLDTGEFLINVDLDGDGENDDVSNLCAGTYQVTIIDNNTECESIVETFIITEPNEFIYSLNITEISCFGLSDGEICLNVSGGCEPYQYNISDGLGNSILNENINEVTDYCLSDLSPDTYTITIVDASDGCNEFVEIINLEEPTEINAILEDSSFTELNCFGDCNGSLQIDVFGGAGFEENGVFDRFLDGIDDDCVSYLWTADIDGDGIEEFTSSELNLNDLCAGTYTLLATDCNGCFNTFSFDITQPEELSATFEVIGACFDDPNGSIDMTIIGGTPGYIISWDNGATTEDISNLSPGDYTVTVTDDNSCIFTETVTIDSSSEITIEINETNENLSCFGDCNGFIDVTSTGGAGILNYEWTGPNGFNSTDEDIFDLCEGTYTLTVTDENNCDASITVEITQPEQILIELISQENLTCNGICTGAIDVNISGGIGSYTYLWSNGSNDEDISNLCAGNYSLIVTDDNLCEAFFETIIIEPDPLIVELELIQNILCNYCDESGSTLEGNEEGRIQVSISGESGPYSFDVYDNSGVLVFSGNTAGNTIFQTDEPGSYYFEVTDANGCNIIVTDSIEITQPDPLCITDVIITDSSCFSFEFNDGSISINVEGGTPIEFGLEEYNYVWSSFGGTPGPFPNSSTINELSAGNYSVVVSDANNCEILSETFEIDEPDPLVLNICSDGSVCCNSNNGTIVATVDGGTPGYIYTLFDEFLVEIGNNNVGVFNGLSAGDYTVTVTDNNWTEDISLIDPFACAAIETVTIEESCPIIEVISEEDAGCSDQAEMILSISGGISPYTLFVDGIEEDIIIADNPSYSLLLNSGNYDIYIIDSNQDLINDCSLIPNPCESPIINININAIPVVFEIQDIIINQPLCPGDDGSMTITANGTAPPDFTSQEANFEIGLDTNGDGSLSLFEVQGAYIDTYSNTEPNYTFIVPYVAVGNYLYNSFDYFDCEEAGEFSINEVTDLNFDNFFTNVDADCNGASGSAYVSTEDIIGGTAPYSVTWYEYDDFGNLIEDPAGTGNANALYAGDYLVVITDFNNCEYEHNFTINEPEESLLANLEVYDPLCFNATSCSGSVTANPTGGQGSNYILTWYDNDDNIILSGLTTSLNNLCEGNYYVVVTDGVCNPIQVNFSIDSPEEISLDISTELLCNGDIIDWDLENNYINISGGTNPIDIWWFNNNVENSNTPILVTNGGGDIVLNSAALDINQDGELNIVDTDDDGDGIDDILDNDPIGLGNGSFWSVLPSNNLDPNISDNGYSISINNLTAGHYYLYILDANGCFQEMLYEITEPDILEVSWNESDLDLFIDCYGENTGSIGIIIEGGTPIDDETWPFPYYYTNWINLNGSSIINSQEISMDDLGPGTYVISIEDANGCIIETEPIEITEANPLVLTESHSEYNCGYGVSCFGASDGSIDLNVSGGITPYNFNWTGPSGFSSTNEDLVNLSAGIYTVIVSSNINNDELIGEDGEPNEGCVQTLTIELTQPEELNMTTISSDYNGFGVSCNNAFDGFIDVIVDGGCEPYTLNWSGPSGGSETEEGISDLVAGDYSITITDNNGCIVNTEIEITEPLPIIFDALNGIDTTPASCKDGNASDGSIIVNTSEISGGIPPYNITLNETNQTISSSIDELVIFDDLSWDIDNDGIIDSYSVTITDSNGCNVTELPIFITYETGTFTVLPSPLYMINPTCESNNDGSILIGSIDGGDLPYTLNWTSNNGFTGNFEWTQDGISNDNIIAGGTPGDIDGDGIYNYADNDIDGDALENNDPLELDIDGDGIENNNDPLPYGNGTELGGILSSGTYYLTVTDANGCISEYTYILDYDTPTFNAELSNYNGFNVSCGENDYNCEEYESNGFITINDINFDHFNTTLLFWPNYTAYPIEVMLNGDLIGLIEDEDSLPYQVTNLEPTIIGGNPINDAYEIQLIDSNGCVISSDDFSIVNEFGLFDMNAPEPIDISLSTGSCPECQDAENGSIDINVFGGVGGYNFYFDYNGDGELIYSYDLDGDCISNNVRCTKLINDNDIDGDGILNFDNDIDGDGIDNFIIDIDGDGILNIDDLDIDGDGILNCDDGLPMGSGQIEEEINGVNFTIVYLDPDIDGDGVDNLNDSSVFGDDNEDIDGDGILNFDSNLTNDIQHEGTDGSLIIDNLPYGNYLIGVSDTNGCNSETTINISNDACQNEVYDWENCLFIPSVFTPNMDGVNDFWEIYNIEIYEPNIILNVYNRWGQLVFDLEGIYNENLWDGSNQSNGSPLEIGVYYYTLELKEYNKTYNGTITIKR